MAETMIKAAVFISVTLIAVLILAWMLREIIQDDRERSKDCQGVEAEMKCHEYKFVALSFLYFVKGAYDWPYWVWVWFDGRVTLDFGCIIK